jgi:hypothetical protein
MKTFFLLVSICSIALCGFSQKSDIADAPFEVLSYSVERLPYRSRLVAFSTPDVSMQRPVGTQPRLPSDIYPTLRRTRETDRRSGDLQNADRDVRATDIDPRQEYQYKMKARNQDLRIIERVFWQYETSDPGDARKVTTRQFLCGNRVKPNDAKEFIVVTPFAPSNVVSVSNARMNLNDAGVGKAIVNRLEYADGTVWENPKWDYARIKPRLNDEVYRAVKGRCVAL